MEYFYDFRRVFFGVTGGMIQAVCAFYFFHMKQGTFAASFGFAFRGLRTVLKTQRNARVHAGATLAVVVAGLWCRVSLAEWCLLTMACAGVWAAEIMNTALEFLADAVTLERNPLIGRAKDAAAGAVLVMAVAAVVVGVVIFAPYVCS